MGAILDFIDFVLDILEDLERHRRRKKRLESESDSALGESGIPVFEYGVMSGFVGSIAALILIGGILLLFGITLTKYSPQVCCLQILSLPIGFVFGLIGKALSQPMRDKFDLQQVTPFGFTTIAVVSFSFLGAFFYTILLYILVVFLAT